MSRIVTKLFGAVLTFGTIGIMSGACVEAEGRLYIDRFSAPGEDGCEAEPEGFSSRSSIQCIDGVCQAASLCVLVKNQMTSSLENPSNYNNVETSTVILHSYDLRYISDDADLGDADTTVQVTAPVEPDGGTANVFLRFLSSEAAAALGSAVEPGSTSSLIVGVRFYGRTTGGLEVETPETFLGVTITSI